jgi:hypothetical protein
MVQFADTATALAQMSMQKNTVQTASAFDIKPA